MSEEIFVSFLADLTEQEYFNFSVSLANASFLKIFIVHRCEIVSGVILSEFVFCNFTAVCVTCFKHL